MAEKAFYLIPADPFHLPDEAARAAVLAYFQEVSPYPNANGSYYFYVYEEPVLFDAGGNLYAVVCPACRRELEINGPPDEMPFENWWDTVYRQATNPASSQPSMPCCGAQVRMLDLEFKEPSAFARFAVGALEPSYSAYWEEEDGAYCFLKPSTLARFEELMGCGVKQIWEVR